MSKSLSILFIYFSPQYNVLFYECIWVLNTTTAALLTWSLPPRQLTVKREGVKTKEMVTPVKVRVQLKVKNREALTYDDINQIRKKVIHTAYTQKNT